MKFECDINEVSNRCVYLFIQLLNCFVFVIYFKLFFLLFLFAVFINRNSTLRKTMSFDNTSSEFSQQSVVFAMEKFSRAVANMDETVMVPCKLMDVPVGSDPELDTRVPRRSRAMIRDMQSADLHSLYTMLNSLKNELTQLLQILFRATKITVFTEDVILTSLHFRLFNQPVLSCRTYIMTVLVELAIMVVVMMMFYFTHG